MKTFSGLLALILCAGSSTAAPTESESKFTFRVAVPPVTVVDNPTTGREVRIEGYGAQPKLPGAPDLPERTVRIAIPPGAVPRLEVISQGEELRRGIRPRPAAKAVVDVLNERDVEPLSESAAGSRSGSPRLTPREVRIEDPTRFAGRSTYPEKLAWLGEIGVLRDQRYVDVHVAPVRFDPRINGLRIAKDIQLVVHFDGDSGKRTAPVTDARFEDIYRGSFENYAQGMTFRIGALAPPALNARRIFALATGPIRRIKIRQNGVVRLDFARMSTTTGFLGANLSTWKLTNRGVEVPLEVNDVNGNDVMESGDWIQFYGQALDDEPKTELNTDLPGDIDIFEHRDYSDENVYFLTTESGVAHSRMTARPSAPTNVRIPANDFESTTHLEVDSPNGYKPLAGNDPWYWMPSISIPVDGPLVPTRTTSVPLPGLASPTANAQVTVKLRGTTEVEGLYPDHVSRVTLKTGGGTDLVNHDDDGSFDGRSIYVHDFAYNGTGVGLTNPAQITIETLSVPGAPVNYWSQMVPDWMEIRYRRLFAAADDVLTFDYPDGDAEFIVSGLASGAPEIYELTSKVGVTGVSSPVRLTGAAPLGGGSFRFRVDNDPTLADGTPRRFVVFGSGAIASVADPDFLLDTESDLRNTANQADMIVIAHPTVLGNASTATLNQLLSYHTGKGITSKIVMIQDVYDEFNDGLAGPQAIKNFLRWVMSTNPGEGWANPKPAYVMLIGDGSTDYKAGETNGSFIPTQIMFLDDPSFGYYASDNVMAAVVGSDQLADLVIGRITARTDGESNVVLAKIRNYQQNVLAAPWKQHVVFASDRGKRDHDGRIDRIESIDFEITNNEALAFMKTPPHTFKKLRYFSDFCDIWNESSPEACDAAGMRTAIRNAVNGDDEFDGAGIFQYVGHGNYDLWSDDDYWDNREPPPPPLVDPDPETLDNATQLPWLLAHGCLVGGFQRPEVRSMGENWLKRQGGGAVAVFGPSGLTYNFASHTVAQTVFNDVFGSKKSRVIAEPVMDSLSQLCGQGSTPACQAYILMGDPAMDLAFPTVAPVTGVTATSNASQQITISWTPSATPPVSYQVFKTTNLANPSYTPVNCTPLTGTSCVETGLINGMSYYYYVLATNGLDFDSRWSNFNSDCATSGPDCVRGVPLNQIPPAAPSGFTLIDAESSGKLALSWAANGEPDLSFYTIHYGTASGAYTVHLNNGKSTVAVLNGLANGTRYYVAITATNTSNVSSANSIERNEVPTFVRGLRAPQVVGNLTLAKSGSDVVLNWGAVTTTIYGKPAVVSKYEVYRGTTLSFVPSPSNLVSPPTQTATTFTDVGALASGQNYFYVVHAVDAQGSGGGLGNQLPMGIDVLTVTKSGAASVILSWPAVTTAFSPTDTPGAPLSINHYEIYAHPAKFTRGDIDSNAVQVLTTTATTTVQFIPPPGTEYYSVIAVDARGNRSPF